MTAVDVGVNDVTERWYRFRIKIGLGRRGELSEVFGKRCNLVQ